MRIALTEDEIYELNKHSEKALRVRGKNLKELAKELAKKAPNTTFIMSTNNNQSVRLESWKKFKSLNEFVEFVIQINIDLSDEEIVKKIEQRVPILKGLIKLSYIENLKSAINYSNKLEKQTNWRELK